MKRERRVTIKAGAAVLPFLFSSFLLMTLAAGPSQKKSQASDALQYEVSVTLKLVQVFVTDHQGRPVKDLNKSDFEIFDNGQRKTITAFEKHFLDLAEKRPGEQAAVEPQKTVAPPAPQPSQLIRKFFFILDIQQNDGLGYLQSKKAALHFLDTQVQPTDEVGLLSYQIRIGLKMHEYLSTDHKKIRKAIENFRGIPGTGQNLELNTDQGHERKATTGSVEGENTEAIIRDLEFPPPNPGADEATMVRMNYVAIMTELAKALRYISGTKNIIFFSAGYARSTLAYDTMFQKNFEEMAKEFGSSASPVYTVNIMGLRAHFVPIDDRGDQSLQDLANFSGGQYFEDVAKVQDIAAGIQNATGNYYVLGYSTDEKWDGQYHEIKVKVLREGCNASAQGGFYNPKPFTEFTEFEKQLHLMDLAFNEHPQFQSPVELPLVLLPCRDESGTHLVFMTELPWDGLKDVLRQATEMMYVVTDQDNNVVENKRGDLQVPDIAKKQVVYYGLLSSKPGVYDCAIVLRNMTTGKAARARGSVTVLQPVYSGLHLDPPLLLVGEADRDVVYLRLTKTDSKAAATSAVALKDLFPFLSNRYVPVVDEIREETSKVLAIVRSTVLDIPNAQIEFSASLKPSAEGDEILLEPSILSGKRQGKTDVLLLEFPLPKLRPGHYTLSITAKDENSEAKAEVSRTIRII
jgi:VWFA-related protein